VVKVATTLSQVLNTRFTYPRYHSKVRLIDYPELTVLASLAVAVKCLWPLDNGKSLRTHSERFPIPRLDWARWLSQNDESSAVVDQKPDLDFAKTTTQDVLKMDEGDFDGYLDHVMTFLEGECECEV